MEENAKLIESLMERVTDYSKTSYELIKLKTLDKTSDVVSSLIPHSIVFLVIASFLLFLNLGLAFWMGELLGNIFFGFFIVAGFYGIVAIVIHFFMHNWLKTYFYNYIIKQVLK